MTLNGHFALNSVSAPVCLELWNLAHMCLVSFKVITRLINKLINKCDDDDGGGGLHCSVPQHRQSSPRGTSHNLGGIGVRCCSQQKTCNISETGRLKQDQGYWVTGSCIRAFDWYQINDLGWPWTAVTHSIAQNMRLSAPTTKIWMKIDPYCFADHSPLLRFLHLSWSRQPYW